MNLAKRLRDHGIDPNKYGIGGYKKLSDLRRELASGECNLVIQAGVLVRELQVLCLNIIYIDKKSYRFRLIEDRQELRKGEVRRRDIDTSIGEKIKKDETIAKAIIRAMKEELGIRLFHAVMLDGPEVRIDNHSRSYPGLTTRYVRFRGEVIIPESEYKPEGYKEVQPDKTTFFVWRKEN